VRSHRRKTVPQCAEKPAHFVDAGVEWFQVRVQPQVTAIRLTCPDSIRPNSSRAPFQFVELALQNLVEQPRLKLIGHVRRPRRHNRRGLARIVIYRIHAHARTLAIPNKGFKGRDSRCRERSVTGDMSESSQGPSGSAIYAFTVKLIERPAAETARSRFQAKSDGYAGANILVARAGIEPATFRFSGGRSYRLSYLAGRHGVPRRSGDPDGTRTRDLRRDRAAR
jgi:hypothetical protein